MPVEKIEIFQNKELFFGLSDDQLRSLAAAAEERSFPAGQPLFREGEMGDALFILQSGGVTLFKKGGDGAPVRLAALPAGTVLGEMTLVNIERRSATAIAEGQTTAVVLKNMALSNLFGQDRELFVILLMNITRILSKRLREANERLTAK